MLIGIPVRIQVGHLSPRIVHRMSRAEVRRDPDAALVRALREVADEIERQAREGE